jgi:hypothetical protein
MTGPRSSVPLLASLCVAAAVNAAGAQIQPRSFWAAGPNDIWVVGAASEPLHYTGGVWRKVPHGWDASVVFYAVWGSAPDNVFFGGESAGLGAIVRWDGHVWTPMPVSVRSPIVALQGRSATEVYALARTGIAGRAPIVLRWDGRTWTEIPLPLPFFATSLGLHGDEVLVAGHEDAAAIQGVGARGVLARLRAGRWSVSGATATGVIDATVASAAWRTVMAFGDTIYLEGELPNGKTAIIASSGAAWATLPEPAEGGNSFPVKLAFATSDGALVALLQGGVGYARWTGGAWTLVRGPDPYDPPPSMGRDELLHNTLAWGEIDGARAAWGTLTDFYVLSSRLVRVKDHSAAVVFDAACADPAVAARSPVCRMLAQP